MGIISNPTFLVHKVVGDSIAPPDPNTLSDIDAEIDANMVALIGASRTYNDTVNGLDARVDALEIADTSKGIWTKEHGGFHGDIIYKDADEIVIKCKHAQGLGAWIGAVLNDGTYLELTADYTIKYDTPANSGHIIDDITAKLNNEFFIVWAYEDSGGALAFGITWMPKTTCSANPTNTITVAQVNAQNIGYLFSADSWIALFEDVDEMETPLGYINAGAWSYDTNHTACKISSRTDTVLTVGTALSKNDFAATTKVYQVNGFKPLQVSDGAIASEIGARGYLDSGFRFRSDAGGNIIRFEVIGKKVLYHPAGALWAGYTIPLANAAFCSYVPPDISEAVIFLTAQDNTVSRVGYYFDVTNNYQIGTSVLSYYNNTNGLLVVPVLHGISYIQGSVGGIFGWNMT